jgi:Ca2+/Na+ antiporter
MPSWSLNAVILVVTILGLVKVGDILVEAIGAIGGHHRFSKDAIARILAFCSSVPELAVVGVSVVEGLLTHNSVVSSVGPYTIMGSAMFNLLLVTGGCAFLIKDGIHLGWKPIIRDLGIYFIGLLALYQGVTVLMRTLRKKNATRGTDS